MKGFEYPTTPHQRRHAPDGYQDYESYRDWLRDEFMFRCVYCLHRERWYGRGGTFNLDHFVPVAMDPDGRLEYVNLLYACATCNNAKRHLFGVPNPCNVAFADLLRINDNGQVEPLNQAGECLVDILQLNSAKTADYRRRWMRTLAALQLHDSTLYQEYMAYPDDLPDLRRKIAPRNPRPESVTDCFFALRECGRLPAEY